MNIEHLIKMANQIGQFFEAEPDQVQAMSDTAAHVKRFWEPRMRQTLIDYAAAGGEGLSPFVIASVKQHRNMLLPAADRV